MKHTVALTSTVTVVYLVDAKDDEAALEAVNELIRLGGDDEAGAILERDEDVIDIEILEVDEEDSK